MEGRSANLRLSSLVASQLKGEGTIINRYVVVGNDNKLHSFGTYPEAMNYQHRKNITNPVQVKPVKEKK